MSAPDLVRVQIEVRENGRVVAQRTIAYFPGQPYEVVINTPDGPDYKSGERKAGS